MSRLSEHQAGALLALMSAVFWGVSGASAQFVFERKGVTVDFLVTYRLLSAGILLLLYARLRGFSIWGIWRERWAAISLLIFGIVGMLAVQYTYFAAIHYSNAATGTILQYVGPTFIAVYFVFVRRRLPTLPEAAAVALAFLGTVLLVTHGDLGTLEISAAALFWGSQFGTRFGVLQHLPSEAVASFPCHRVGRLEHGDRRHWVHGIQPAHNRSRHLGFLNFCSSRLYCFFRNIHRLLQLPGRREAHRPRKIQPIRLR